MSVLVLLCLCLQVRIQRGARGPYRPPAKTSHKKMVATCGALYLMFLAPSPSDNHEPTTALILPEATYINNNSESEQFSCVQSYLPTQVLSKRRQCRQLCSVSMLFAIATGNSGRSADF